MEHAITLGDVVFVIGGIVGFIAIGTLFVLLVYLTNPFRGGH